MKTKYTLFLIALVFSSCVNSGGTNSESNNYLPNDSELNYISGIVTNYTDSKFATASELKEMEKTLHGYFIDEGYPNPSVSGVSIKSKKDNCFTVSYDVRMRSTNNTTVDVNFQNGIIKKDDNGYSVLMRGKTGDLHDVSKSNTQSERKSNERVDLDKIEDALQLYNMSLYNPNCNVFKVKITGTQLDNYIVSYTLRSTWSNGHKTFVDFKGAKISRDGTYTVLDGGYN